MSYEDHLKTCSYCRKGSLKPTILIKSASSYNKRKRLAELGAIIKGISYPGLESIPMFRTKGASESLVARKPGPIEREVKLRELGKMIRGK
ncbi:MAG: hypothetical protein WA326_02330 [Nitrososphaeraceae archaeon]